MSTPSMPNETPSPTGFGFDSLDERIWPLATAIHSPSPYATELSPCVSALLPSLVVATWAQGAASALPYTTPVTLLDPRLPTAVQRPLP